MNEREQNVARFLELRLFEFRFVQKVSVTQSSDTIHERTHLNVQLELRNERTDDERILYLTFSGVRELRLVQVWYPLRLAQLVIECIDYRQWEDTHYRVSEEEDNTLAFYSRDFDFRLVSPVLPVD